MFKSPFGSAFLRLFSLVAFVLCFSGLVHAQQPIRPTIEITAQPPSPEGAPANFRVTLSNPATQRLTFTFSITPGAFGPEATGANATGAREVPEGGFDADYLRSNGDFTLEVGASQLIIPVETIDDKSYEFDETFNVRISNFRYNGGGNAPLTLGRTTATGTILNDDAPPTVTLVTPDPILEGDTINRARQNYNFTVSLNNTLAGPNTEVLGRPIQLAFATIDGTATSRGVNPGGSDFTPIPSSQTDGDVNGDGVIDANDINNGIVNVPAGTRQFQYTVVVKGDDIYEGNENFRLRVDYSPPLANTAPSTAVGNIRDNDLPTYVIDPVDSQPSVEEGNPISFAIKLRKVGVNQGDEVAALDDIVFRYSVQPTTATLNADFTNPNGGTFTIPRGSSSFIVNFPTIADGLIESTETFRFIITDAQGTTAPTGFGANVGTGTIFDTADNNSGTTFTIQDVSVLEGTGTDVDTQLVFTVRLSRPTGQSASVAYETNASVDPNTNARATAGADYTPISGRITFAPNQVTQTFSVQIAPDAINELDENFRVRLFEPVNANLANGAVEIFAKGIIIDDDAAGIITVERGDVNVAENVPGGVVNILVNFRPTGPQVRPVTVDFNTLPDTAQQAGQRDYFGKAGTLTFRPNASNIPTQLAIPIEIIDDNFFEGNETFTVRLSNPNGAVLGNQPEEAATNVTIVDNESLPVVSVFPAAPVNEASGVKNFVIAIQGRSQAPVVVDYSFINGTAVNGPDAASGADYQGTAGTRTFAPGGATSFFIQATIFDDQIAEGNETFSLALNKNPNDNSFLLPRETATSEVVIVDDEARPSLRIADASVQEGNTGTQATGAELVFPVTLSGASSRPVSFNYSSFNLRRPNCIPANGCETATNADYAIIRNATLNFAPGQTRSAIRVRITPDTLNEFNEQFQISARNLINTEPLVYSDANDDSQRFGTTAFGTIVNDDIGGNITLSGPTATAGGAAITTIAEGYDRGGVRRIGEAVFFTITLPAPAGRTVTVNYSLDGGVAKRADVQDLTTGPGNGQVTFFNGDVSREISVRALADNLAEGSERLNVSLSINDNNGVNSYTANGANSNVTILDRTPQVNTVTPTIGFPTYGTVPATRLTISGANFRNDNNPRIDAVLFNGIASPSGSVRYLSDNAISVDVPDGAKTGPLTLRLVDNTTVSTLGLSAAVPVSPIPDFVVQPVITGFTPTTGIVDSSTIRIMGRNFQDPLNAVTGVRFSNDATALTGTEGQVTVVSDTEIELKVTSGASNGPLRIVSAKGGAGPASQTNFVVVNAAGGNIVLGPNPDRNAILEGSGISFGQPARNVNGGFHAPYQFFLNPARQSSGPSAGQPVAFTRLTVRFTIVANTGGGNVPRIQLRFDPENAGRPTAFSGKSGSNQILDIELTEKFNPASPLEIAIVDAGTDNVAPITGGVPANVTVTAQIISSSVPAFFPITPANQIPTIRVDRVEPVTNNNQTAIVYSAGTQTNISVPFAAGNTNSVAIADVFTTAPSPTTYSIYRLNAATQTNELTPGRNLELVTNGRLERGIGYRLIVANNATAQLKTRTDNQNRPLVTPAGNTFALNLTRNVAFAAGANGQGNSTNGYNFVGFPFNPTQFGNVDFSQALVTIDGVQRSVPDAAAAGLINPQLFTLDASGALVPANTTIIQPFQSYIVQIFRNNATLTLRNPMR